MTDSQNKDLNNLVLTLDDFKNSGWKDALGPPEERCYSFMHLNLETAARIAFNNDQPARGKALLLLSNACSMMLEPESRSEPFKPIYKNYSSGRRSYIPDDFLKPDLEFFAEILEHIDDARLKARLADILWLTAAPRRDRKTALTAIDSYRSIPLDFDNWSRDGKECWHRALALAFMQKSGAGERVADMEEAIVRAIESVESPNGFFCVELAGFLKSLDLGENHTLKIAEKLESFVIEADLSSTIANLYWTAVEWLSAAGENARSVRAIVKMAECYVKDGDGHASAGGHAAATLFYLQAIQAFQKIQNKDRAAHQVDDRIAALKKKHEESKNKIADDMSSASASVPIRDIIEHSCKAVSGKSPMDALFAFMSLDCGADVESLRKNAKADIKRHPSLSLLPRYYLGSDDRLVGKRPPADIEKLNMDDDPVILEQMMFRHRTYIAIVVRGSILPALRVLHLEHRFREADFVNIARQSAIVPIDRKLLYGKSLAAGYDYDFATAIHLLAPQIENIVRQLLKASGARTTTFDEHGFEKEIGLSNLMQKQESKDILGKNLHFEIDTVFCSSLGPNIRNEVAHGLVDDMSVTSHAGFSIYAWWIGMRLAFANLAKERLDSLMEAYDESDPPEEVDAGEPVGREAW